MNTVYIVEGYSGEYDDYREWPVCAYPDRKAARQHANLAKARADELFAKHGEHYNIPAGANRFDRKMSPDYTGVSYRVYSIRVRYSNPR